MQKWFYINGRETNGSQWRQREKRGKSVTEMTNFNERRFGLKRTPQNLLISLWITEDGPSSCEEKKLGPTNCIIFDRWIVPKISKLAAFNICYAAGRLGDVMLHARVGKAGGNRESALRASHAGKEIFQYFGALLLQNAARHRKPVIQPGISAQPV